MGLSLRCLHIGDTIDHMGRHGFGRLYLLGLHLGGDVKDKAIVSREKALGFLRNLLLVHTWYFSLLSVWCPGLMPIVSAITSVTDSQLLTVGNIYIP